MGRKRRISLADASCPSNSSMSVPAPEPKPKHPSAKAIFRSMCPPIKKKYFQPFNKNGNAAYVVPILEAVYSAADVLPALKSVAGGVLWIARVIQEYKSSGKDEKEFADYLQECVACVIASAAEHGDITSVEPRMEELNGVIDEIRKDILHWRSQPLLKRFGRFIKNRRPTQEHKARFDQALIVFNLGSTVSSREELAKISGNIKLILGTLQSVDRQVSEGIAQMADGMQQRIGQLDNHLERVASVIDSTHERVGTFPVDVAAAVRKELDGLATVDHVRRLEIQIQTQKTGGFTSKVFAFGVFLG